MELIGASLDGLLAGSNVEAAFDGPPLSRIPAGATVAVPLDGQELWAAGVTFTRSRQARKEESYAPDFYDKVYVAERPELFVKASPGRVQGPGDPVAVRRDSAWNVPEPELALLADATGHLVAYSLGNDMSSRSIEGENPLYLPQAKVYRHSASVGPCWLLVADAPELSSLIIHLRITRSGTPLFEDEACLSAMRRTPRELLDWLFRAQEFPVGVALLTGTSIVPGQEISLGAGDVISIWIDQIGQLENVVEVF
jgi:2-dehydro-3-deoxy-D-arabinonate dehydratase